MNHLTDAIGTDEEQAVLNILSALSSQAIFGKPVAGKGNGAVPDLEFDDGGYMVSNPKADQFLENLLAKKSAGEPLFVRLYNKINDWGGEDNFTTLLQTLYIAWVQSSHFTGFAYPLEYKSEELLGFYSTSHDFVLSKDARHIAGFKLKEFWSLDIVPTYIRTVGVYDRIGLQNIGAIETPDEIKIPTLVPAFFIKGIDDKTSAANLEKAIKVSLDVLTTLTGIGNLVKFRNLYRIWKAGSSGSKLLIAVKVGVSGIEITSGALGTMLELAGSSCKGPFCDGLRNCLFWMDMASLSVDVVTSRMLRNSARNTLKNLDSLPAMKQAEYDELVDSLNRMAGTKRVLNAGELERDILKKLNVINKSKIMNYDDFLELAAKIKKTFGVDLKVVSRVSDGSTELFKRWQDNPIYAVFHHKKFKNGRYQIVLDGPAIYFFSGFSRRLRGTLEITTYTVQHELFHLKLWHKLEKVSGNKISRRIHEEYVLSEFVKSAEKWELDDLMNDLKVYNQNFRKPLNLPYLDLDYFKTWNLETELKKVKF